jgi:N-acetylmuramoyl-L-alanine amidase
MCLDGVPSLGDPMQRAGSSPTLNPRPDRRARLSLYVAAALALFAPAVLGAAPQFGTGRNASFAHAERMREALEGRPEAQRTRLQYERVLDAYRAIYHSDPASPKADASIAAVADLLAEEGRVFQDAKALRDAIGQYEFLRRQYPSSRFRSGALLTEGEIYQRDFGDLDQAKALYLSFLHLYPESPLAGEAQSELRSIRHLQLARRRGGENGTTVATENSGSGRRTSPAYRTPPAAARAGSASSSSGSAAQTAHTAQAAPPPRAAAPAAQSAGTQETEVPSLLPPTEAAPPSAQGRSAGEAPAETAAADDLNAPPPPSRSALPLITGIRHWSTPVYTRVAIDLQQEVRYTAARVPYPDRIFFDLYGARLSPELAGRSLEVTDDGFLSSIRVVQFGGNIVRIVLDVNSVSDYSAFFLSNPSRLIIDVHGQRVAPPMQIAQKTTIRAGIGVGPAVSQPPAVAAKNSGTVQNNAAPATTRTGVFANADPSDQPPTNLAESNLPSPAESRSALADVATLSHQPDEVRATKRPTTAPIVASVATPPPPASTAGSPAAGATTASTTRRNTRTAKPSAVRATDDVPPATAGAPGVSAGPPPAPAADNIAAGRAPNSMMRALGLKINRIVIDAGHGGHDSGTLGPGGIEEKDVVLDVALRLGKLLKQRLGAEVIYTRSDDTFIPLETRTAIANQAQADLFISIHANSSPDTAARGVEVYYLSFTSSADALEVAARENAASDESIHQLSDLVKKIALSDKINESRAFAQDVDESLYAGLDEGNPGLKDRGVKKAPFVVLIGANMPSILAEISFLTNPSDAQELRQPEYRQRIAESLYRGVSRYVGSMNGMRVAQAGSRTGTSE